MKYFEYIESSGTQYINTGKRSTEFDHIIIDTALLTTPGSWGCLFGLMGNYSTGGQSVIATWTNNRFQFRWGGQNVNMLSPVTLGQRYKYSWDNISELYVDDAPQGSSTSGAVSTTITLKLFCNDWGTIGQFTSQRCYGFKLFLAGEPVLDLVPAADDSNVVCMYDTLSGEFYYNSGSGVFTPGPEIAPPGPVGPGFEIVIQHNLSDNIQLDKELEDLLTVQGILREETSIIDPVLLIECDLAQVTKCNYITIPQFGRSYFVQEIVSVRTGLVEFTCHVDVLSSFAEEIRANTGIVFKSQDPQAYNTYLDDGGLRTYANPFVLTEPFPGGFSGASFVLAVAGSAST